MANKKSNSDWGCALIAFILLLVFSLIAMFTDWIFGDPKEGTIKGTLSMFLGIALFYTLLRAIGLIGSTNDKD